MVQIIRVEPKSESHHAICLFFPHFIEIGGIFLPFLGPGVNALAAVGRSNCSEILSPPCIVGCRQNMYI